MLPHPRLRQLPTRRQGEYWRIEDPLGVAHPPGAPLALPDSVYQLAIRLDGRRSLAELSQSGAISALEWESLVYGLSNQGLLEDAVFQDKLRTQWELYRSSPERPFAGTDRERDPFALRAAIAGMVADDWDMPASRAPQALLVPAAPLNLGARLYGRGFASVRHVGTHFARVVLLGDAPLPLPPGLVSEDRDCATPIGSLRTDRAALQALGLEANPWQLAQRGALSLEPCMLFLRVLLPRIPIVPLLVSSELAHGAQALASFEGLRHLPGPSLLICAADLAQGPADAHTRARDVLRNEALCNLDIASLTEASSDPASPALQLLARYLAQHKPRLSGNTLGYQALPAPHEGRLAAILFQDESSLETAS